MLQKRALNPNRKNWKVPGENVGMGQGINKYLLFEQQYFELGCKHGPLPIKLELLSAFTADKNLSA